MMELLKPLRALSEIAPVLGLGVLLGLPPLLSQERVESVELAARNDFVQNAFDAVPMRIGAWIGEEIEVPAAAIEILQTNAILSRRYRHLTSGASANLLVVHCSDARDMQGHYPPVCYPASGWILPATADNQQMACPAGSGVAAGTIYDFERLDDFGAKRRLRVVNYFLLPDGTTSPDITVLNRLVRKRSRSVQGVAQIQVTMDGSASRETAEHAVQELLNGIGPLLEVLGDGERDHDQVES